MKRIELADNAIVVSGVNQFTEGNPPTVPRTKFRDYFANGVQEEIMGVIEGAGLTPSGANNKQLLQAIQMASPTGMVSAFAGASAPAGWLLCNGAVLSQTTYAALFAVIGSTYDLAVNPTTGSAYASPGAGNFRAPDYRSLFLRGVGTNNLSVATTLGGWQDDATNKNGIILTGGAYSLAVTHPTVTYTPQALTGVTTFSAGGHKHTLPISTTNGVAFYPQDASQRPLFGEINVNAPLLKSSTISVSSPGIVPLDLSDVPDTTASVSISAGGATYNNGTYTLLGSAASLSAGDTETRPQNVGVNYIIRT